MLLPEIRLATDEAFVIRTQGLVSHPRGMVFGWPIWRGLFVQAAKATPQRGSEECARERDHEHRSSDERRTADEGQHGPEMLSSGIMRPSRRARASLVAYVVGNTMPPRDPNNEATAGGGLKPQDARPAQPRAALGQAYRQGTERHSHRAVERSQGPQCDATGGDARLAAAMVEGMPPASRCGNTPAGTSRTPTGAYYPK